MVQQKSILKFKQDTFAGESKRTSTHACSQLQSAQKKGDYRRSNEREEKKPGDPWGVGSDWNVQLHFKGN